MVLQIGVRMEAPLAGVALRRGFIVDDGSEEAENEPLLGESNRFKVQNKQFMKTPLEKIPR